MNLVFILQKFVEFGENGNCQGKDFYFVISVNRGFEFGEFREGKERKMFFLCFIYVYLIYIA